MSLRAIRYSLCALLGFLPGQVAAAGAGWPAYGGDQGGMRFSQAAQITPANVTTLTRAWTYSTGDMKTKGRAMRRASFENTPILADGRLYVCSPFNEISALDPATGKQIWRFDPKLDAKVHYPNDFVCRGVAFRRDPKRDADAVCAAEIFTATNDRRLIALDAGTGRPCPGFGVNGTVYVKPEPKMFRNGAMQITSAPVVAHGLVIVGSSIDDNQRVEETRGIVRAYDAETGALEWRFDPIARTPDAPNAASWQGPDAMKAGAANVWGPMSVDAARGLVFVPTSSPSPDFYGGLRRGDNRYADSVVALKIDTGAVAWSFQVTHHDVWDYDVPAQPTLATIPYKGRRVAAVLQPTKQGLLFTLDRETGAPVIPVIERTVPQDGAPGETLSPTQPFPTAPKPLAASTIAPEQAYGITFWDRGRCRAIIERSKHEGLYTPPSTQGTIVYPFTGGGTNWGGLAFDPETGIAYVNTSNMMHLITLFRAKDFAAMRKRYPHQEVSPQTGAPFGMKREVITSPLGLPCNPPPWGQLHAVDMHTGHVLWEVPLGTTEDLLPYSQYILGTIGVPNIGGPIATAGGLVFIAATMDDYIRAFDARSGAELWKARLPAGGQATPMSYVWKGRQYVVIAAGGHSKLDTERGDEIVAYALPN
jgi:quinoprotein glucose dehydrogenase